jgi:hypothetical protein
MGEVSDVLLVIEAHEVGNKTVIKGTLTAYAPLNYRCWLIRRIAHRKAPAIMDMELRRELAKIERRGREIAGRGESGLLGAIISVVTRLRNR